MWLCACGYSCGTETALTRHLDRQVSDQCQAVAAEEAPVELEDDSPDVKLRAAIIAGDPAATSLALDEGATLQPQLMSMAVQAGHVRVASQLIRHCRSRKYARPLDRVNAVANTLNWAAGGHCSTAGPAMIGMLVRDKHIDATLRKGPLDMWRRLSSLLTPASPTASYPGASLFFQYEADHDDHDDPFTNAGRAAIAAAQRAAVPPSHHATWASARARRPGGARPSRCQTRMKCVACCPSAQPHREGAAS
jgi:hypothetical protein